MRYSKIVTGILAGIVIGILIAPDKGDKTRKKISKVINNAGDCIVGFIDETREELNSLADEAIDKVETTEDAANKAFLT